MLSILEWWYSLQLCDLLHFSCLFFKIHRQSRSRIRTN